VLGEELRLLQQAGANVDGIGAITQVDIDSLHALGACRGDSHPERGGAGRAADGDGRGEEERVDEGGEKEEEREKAAACHRH
jgi:hypothetical protein